MFRVVQRHIGVFAVLFAFALGPCLHAQSTPIVEEPGYTPTFTFDVVSIHLAPPPDFNFHPSASNPPHSSRFDGKDLSLESLVQGAYDSNDHAPISGGPNWLGNTFYNLQCRSDEAADARLAKLSDNEARLEKRNAIRVLLAERMNLKTHFETRNSLVYNLVIAKGGVKMIVAPAPSSPANGEGPPPPSPADFKSRSSQRGMEVVGTDSSMRAIAIFLSSMVGTSVIDKTGLTGTYNYTLQFGAPWSESEPDSWPPILTAAQEQLGLKLEAVHEPIPILVIDHIMKPTEN